MNLFEIRFFLKKIPFYRITQFFLINPKIEILFFKNFKFLKLLNLNFNYFNIFKKKLKYKLKLNKLILSNNQINQI